MSEEITLDRAGAVGIAIKLLVESANSVTEQESGSITQGEKVLRAFLAFKQEVKGIGFFR